MTAAKASKPKSITPRVLKRIEQHVELMRWSSHETDDEIVPGSLADEFWNSDVPRLIEAARRSLG